MKKKFTWSSLLLLICVVLLSACSNNGGTAANSSQTQTTNTTNDTSETKGPVTIEFMGHGNPNEKSIFEKLIASFEEKFPHVTVKYTSVPPGEYSQKLTTLISSGKAPDVFYVGGSEFYRFAEAGTVMNLQSYLDGTDLFNQDNVWKQALDRYRFDGSNVGSGDLHGLPKDVGPWAFVYNKDLFDAKNITPPSAVAGEWTWDDMLAAAKQITEDTNNDGKPDVYGVAAYSLESAVWGNGGQFIDYTTGTVLVHEPAFYEAMQYAADLNLVHGVSPNTEAEQSMNGYTRFLNGQLAMFAMGPWDQPAFWELPFNWDIGAWPASPNTGETATWLGSMGFAISNKSKHPQEAFDLAAFLSLDEFGQRQNYELGQAVPNLIDMSQGEFLAVEKSPSNRQVFLDIIQDYGRPDIPAFSKDTQWIDLFWQQASQVWNGDVTAQEFTQEISPKMQELYDKFNK